ncbi:MAG: hypothetical protein IJ422_07320 [Oscillospiraceae bacterium]|nr:hypothetical protein [Oscillospiraceae bacterium]
MKNKKTQDFIALGALLGILLLFGALAFGVSAKTLVILSALTVAAGLVAMMIRKGLLRFGLAKPAVRAVTIGALCIMIVCNAVLFAYAASVNVTNNGFAQNLLSISAASSLGGNKVSASSVNASGNTATVYAVGYDTDATCDDATVDADTVTVTITNSTNTALQFDLTISSGVTIVTDGVTAETGRVLGAGSSILFKLTSKSGDKSDKADVTNGKFTNTGTITIQNIVAVESNADVDTTFKPSVGGTFTVDGTAVTEETVKTKGSQQLYTLAAIPNTGYTFYGWASEKFGFFTTNSYDATEGTEDTVWPIFRKTGSAMYTIQGVQPTIYYSHFDEALTVAGESGTIVVHESGTLYGSTGQTDFSMTSGQKLLVPFSDTDTGVFSKLYEDAKLENASGKNVAFRTLTIPSGTKLTCDGQINVNGQRKVTGQGAAGTGIPKGGHGKIVLEGSGTQLEITSNGALYCYGFISGTGTVELSGGKMHELMQVYDWAGGSNVSGWYTTTTLWKDEATKAKTLFFLAHYYVQNVEAPLKVNTGSSMYVEAVLTASGSQVHTSAQILGNSSSTEGLFLLGSGTYLTRAYDPTTDRVTYTLCASNPAAGGTVDFGSLKVTASGNELDSKAYTLGLNNALTVHIGSGVTMNMSNRVALMPGSEVIVDEGGKLKLTNHLYIMDIADKTGLFFANQLAPLYTAGRGTTVKMSVSSSARLEVNGELNISGSGNVYTTTGPNSTATTSTDKIIYGTGKIINNGTLGAGTLRGGYSSSLTTLTVANGLLNLAGDGEMKNIGNATYTGLGSDHNNYWYISSTPVDATCTTDAYTAYWCSDATSTYDVEVADSALGHDFQDWSITTAATLTTQSTETSTCNRDNCTETDTRHPHSAQIGDVTYDTLQNALTYAAQQTQNEAKFDNPTVPVVTLLTEFTADTIPISQLVTINQGDHTISLTPDTDYRVIDNGDKSFTFRSSKVNIYATNLKVTDSLDLNFYVRKCDLVAGENYTAVISRSVDGKDEPEVISIVRGEWIDFSDTLMRFSYTGLAAKEMTDNIAVTIMLVNDTPAGSTCNASVQSYAIGALEAYKSDSEHDTKLRTALMDMLNYGAAAQLHFGYNTDSLANVDPESAETKTIENHIGEQTPALGTCENNLSKGSSFAGVTVSAKNRLMFTFYYNISDPTGMRAEIDYNGQTIQIAGADFYERAAGSLYGVDLVDLKIVHGRQMLTCRLYDSNGTLISTSTDSVEGYVSRNSTSETDVFAQLMKFADSASAYLAYE